METIYFNTETVTNPDEIYDYMWRRWNNYMSDEDKADEYSNDFDNYTAYFSTELEHFYDGTALNLLRDYVNERYGAEMPYLDDPLEYVVRGFVSDNRRGLYMTHGWGYSWLDADLLGGNGSGENLNDFKRWAEDRGYNISEVIG